MSRTVRKSKIFRIFAAGTETQNKRSWNSTLTKVCKKLIRLEKQVPVKIENITTVD